MLETTKDRIIATVRTHYSGSARFDGAVVASENPNHICVVAFTLPDDHQSVERKILLAAVRSLQIAPDAIHSIISEDDTFNVYVKRLPEPSAPVDPPEKSHAEQYAANAAYIAAETAALRRYDLYGTLAQSTADDYQLSAYRTSKKEYAPLTFQQFELVHAILGLASELGELAGTVKKHIIYGQPLDIDNVGEETGDLDWYLNLARTAVSLLSSRVRQANINKLRKRYPNEYSDADAAARADKQLDASERDIEPLDDDDFEDDGSHGGSPRETSED